MRTKWYWLLMIIVGLAACQPSESPELFRSFDLMEIPVGFPSMVEPEDNHFTKARWQLGKRLFFDPVMSVDSSVSCASCHKPSLAFSDNQIFSPGVANRPGVRNSPSLANIGFHPYFTREGGVPTLEMQVFVPIQEHNEFNFNILLLADRLARDSSYVQQSLEAYGRTPDPFVITRSLACFERSLISGYSAYDRYLSYGDKDALSEAERRGMDLFFSEKANCSSCHSDFNFTDYSFSNNGLYLQYDDNGRERLTGLPEDRALFKVPSLRNIALTAPYMHDGSFSNLDAVLHHYNKGGEAHSHRDNRIKPLTLSTDDLADLKAFLHALTDETFINNPNFQP